MAHPLLFLVYRLREQQTLTFPIVSHFSEQVLGKEDIAEFDRLVQC